VFASTGFRFTPACNTVMQMRFNQQRTGRAELARTILGKELTNIVAAPDGFNLPRRSRKFLSYALPYTVAGRAYDLAIGLVSAHGGHGLLQLLLGILGWVLHRDCLVC
jgi:hypothetical protein